MPNIYDDDAVIKSLCEDLKKNSVIDPGFYEKYHVKRGLRNSDGSGVPAGITKVCSVHGYMMDDCEKLSIEGELFFRGYSIVDCVENVEKEDRFGYEEIVFLLLFGRLPDRKSTRLNSSHP